MAKPLTEHSTKLRAGKGKKSGSEEPAPARSSQLEPVEGGRVRRIVFEGREPEPTPEPTPRERDPSAWRPRHEASMSDIEFEVDNLNRFKDRRRKAPSDEPVETDTVYETDRSAVRSARQGDRRVFYTEDDKGERRFSPHMVDRLLAERDPYEEEVVKEESVEHVPRRRKVVEEVVVEPKKRRAKRPKKKQEPASDYQPQCEAVTRTGVQCRNSAKTGTAFCSSHQGYKAQKLSSIRDTEPRVAGAQDTLPGSGSSRTTDGKQAQCGAYTNNGMQCRNSSRKGSKYCSTHKGYRRPSKDQLESRLDTKPRWDKAPDTKPRLK